MAEGTSPSQVAQPNILPFVRQTLIACTACGRNLLAVGVSTPKAADALLYCDGCKQRGVGCWCQPVARHVGFGR